MKHRIGLPAIFAAIAIWWTLFAVKISLLDFGGSSIRLEDFVIAICFPGLIATRGALPRFHEKWIRLFWTYLAICFLSSSANAALGRVEFVQALVFSIRNIEYFTFIYFGYVYAKAGFSLALPLYFYIPYSIIITLFQQSGVLGNQSRFSLSRWSGNTSGPYEFSVVLVIAFVIIVSSSLKLRKIMAVASLMLLIGTASRISLVAAAIVGYRRIRRGGVALVIAFGTFAILMSVILAIGSNDRSDSETSGGIVARFESLLGKGRFNELIDNISYHADQQPAVETAAEYAKTSFADAIKLASDDIDASAFIRFYRWTILTRSTMADPLSMLIGLGPSFGTSAVDGNYIRLFVETGFLGLLSFVMFLFYCYRYAKKVGDDVLIGAIIAISISSLFIDIFVSFRPMFLFWTCAGYSLWIFSAESRALKGKAKG